MIIVRAYEESYDGPWVPIFWGVVEKSQSSALGFMAAFCPGRSLLGYEGLGFRANAPRITSAQGYQKL